MMPTPTIASADMLPISSRPKAWVVVGASKFPTQILSASFHGGILETEATLAVGAWVPLEVSNGVEQIALHVHILEVSGTKMAFRLYGTDGTARNLWEALVRDLRRTRKHLRPTPC